MSKGVDTGMQDMEQISSADIPEMVERFRKTGQVVYFIGQPGTGKTQAVFHAARIIAKKMGLNYVDTPSLADWSDPNNFCVGSIMASQIEEMDTKGVPTIEKMENGSKITIFTPTELFPREGTGILFCDEFANGRSSVQNAFQPIFLEHKSGSFKISANIQFVLASNRPQDNCGTFNVPAALRNRVAWFEVSPPPLEEWISLMIKLNRAIDPRITGFLLSVGSKYIGDDFDAKRNSYAYPSRRTLEMASEAIRGEKNFKMIKRLVGALLGAGAGFDLASFLELSEKVNVDNLLNNPKEINKYLGDPGTLYSICIALVDNGKDMARSEKVLNVLMALSADEFGLFVVQGMMREYGPDGVMKRVNSAPNVGPQLMNKYVHLIKAKD